MPSLSFSRVSFSYSSRPLIERLSLTVGECERAFITGPNGCGKTTLLSLASGRLSPESGTVSIDGAAETAPLVEGFSGSIADYLEEAFASLRALAARFDHLTALLADEHANTNPQALAQEYDEVLARMNARDVWGLDARVDEVLAEFGLAMLAGPGRNRAVDSLSPGQRGRLQLAVTLVLRPDVLILDEPTNHLDRKAVEFLTKVVSEWDGPVLMTSHDRAFIEDTATVIYDLDTVVWRELAKVDPGIVVDGAYRCAGRYSDFLKAKQRAHRRHAQVHESQQSEKRGIQEHRQASGAIAKGGVRVATAQGIQKKFFSDRAAATAVRRTRNDDRRLDSLAEVEVCKPRDYELQFDLPQVTPRPGIAVAARHAGVTARLAPVDLDLARGEHLLIVGDNGAGKSTLLTWIATGHPPTGAEATGILVVDSMASFVPQRLPVEFDADLSQEIFDGGIGELGKGIVHPALWNTPIPALSAGNQRRAQLALALSKRPELLVIDEPTNYLDLATMEALEAALPEWGGTLIIASHDRWLIEHWHGRTLQLHPIRE